MNIWLFLEEHYTNIIGSFLKFYLKYIYICIGILFPQNPLKGCESIIMTNKR